MNKIFKEACYEVFTGLYDTNLYSGAYGAIKELFWFMTVVIARLFILVLFPITLPLMMLLIMHINKKVNSSSLSMRARKHLEVRKTEGKANE